MLTRVLDPQDKNGLTDVSEQVKKQEKGAETSEVNANSFIFKHIQSPVCKVKQWLWLCGIKSAAGGQAMWFS